MLVQDSYGFVQAGTTIVSVDPSLTFATLSRNGLNGQSVDGLALTLIHVQTVTGATLTSNTSTGQASLTLSSCTAGSCFNANDVGLFAYATGADIPSGTTIASYTSPTKVTLSGNAVGNASLVNMTLLVGGSRQITATLTYSSGTSTLTCQFACFSAADVGSSVTDID